MTDKSLLHDNAKVVRLHISEISLGILGSIYQGVTQEIHGFGQRGYADSSLCKRGQGEMWEDDKLWPLLEKAM